MKIRMLESPGTSVQEILDEFNERMDEFDVSPENIISVQTEVVDPPVKIHNPNGPAQEGRVALRIFYWG